MGVSMNPRYYDPIYIPPSRYHYPPPSRIIYINPSMNGMAPLPPQFVPIPPNQRIMYGPHQMIVIPHGPMPIPQKKQKKTIDNLGEIIGEQDLTQEMLEKGEQKNCSICLDDFAVGDKIIYLPCFHYYHAKCIEKWTQSSDKCPLCNIEIKIQ